MKIITTLLIALFLFVLKTDLKAQNLDMSGIVTYNKFGNYVTISCGRIDHSIYSNFYISGTLYLQLWTCYTPYNGLQSSLGFKVAEATIEPLLAGYYFSNVVETVPFYAPPNGAYYMVMVLAESNGYEPLTVDWFNFPNLETFGYTAPPPPPVVIPPSITSQPNSRSVNVGSSATFSITATGTNSFYQWKRNGVDLAGETGATLSLNNVQSSQAGSYTVVISNSAGSVTSNAAVLTIFSITSSLDLLTLKVGSAMSYAVIANSAPTTYAAKSLPVGLKINAKTGMVSGKPTKAGEYIVTLQALRKGAATVSALKTFRVLQTPTFTLPTKVNLTRNKAFMLTSKVLAYPAASFSVVSGVLPEGITLNPTTGQISGNSATLKGNYPVTIRGSNEAGMTDIKTVFLIK